MVAIKFQDLESSSRKKIKSWPGHLWVNVAQVRGMETTKVSLQTFSLQVSVSVANCMSLFFAQATPMLTAISGATSNYVSELEVQVGRRLS